MGDSKRYNNDFTEPEPMVTDTPDTQGGDPSKTRKKKDTGFKNYKEKMKTLTEENERYKNEIAELTAENESIMKKLQPYQPQFGAQLSLEEFVKDILEENRTVNNKLSSSKDLVSKLKQQLCNSNETTEVLRQQLNDSQKDIERLKEQLNQSEQKTGSAMELQKGLEEVKRHYEKELEEVKMHYEQEKYEMQSNMTKYETDMNMYWKEIVGNIEKEKLALQQEIARKEKANQNLTTEFQNYCSAYTFEKEQFEAAKKQFESRIHNLEKQIRILNGKKEESDNLASKRQNTIAQKEREIWQCQQHIQQIQTDLNNHITTIKSLEKDKKDLTLRLSKLAGANLTYNNPNIADLSDENRPTKLAEEFSELYDNEWTDAFEAVDMENEKAKTQFMLNILKNVSRLCHDTSRNHMDAIKNSLSTLVIRDLWAEEEDEIPEEKVNGASASTQGDESYTVKTNQQGKHVSSSENDKGNKQDESEDIKNNADAVNTSQPKVEDNAGVDTQRTAGDQTADGNPNDNTGGKTNEVPHNLQGEPVLDDSLKLNKEKNLFGLITRENHATPEMNAADGINTGNCTKDGKVDYQTECEGVNADSATGRNTCEKTTGQSHHDSERDASNVVPDSDTGKSDTDLHEERSHTPGNEIKKSDANDNKNKDNKKGRSSKRCSKNRKPFHPINLHADFEELASEQKKTILEIRKYFEHHLSEQFYKVGSSIIEKEMGIDQHAHESIVKYIEKCMTICWSMCRHEPPVHIEFFEAEGELKYDTNMFKPYTKTGKHLDFVVWPALYLHEGGPMLSKGVAQGRK